MKYFSKKYIFIALISLILGCEEVDIVEIELEHQEKIVVQSELIANEFFSGVSLTKTLPLNEIYSIEKAEITDALVFLIVDAAKIIPLHYRGNGNYKSLVPFKIKSGRTYELYASIADEEIYSITIVPQIPLVNSQRYVADGYLSASVKSNIGEAYGAIWIIANNELSSPNDQASDFYSISNLDGSGSNRNIAVRTTKLSNNYLNQFYSDKMFMQVYAFDTAYLDYFYTKNNNNPIEDSFSQGGAPIKWNISGENAIGMFIGFAKSDFIKINR
jgi:Domain of unknown function (DUF4249)